MPGVVVLVPVVTPLTESPGLSRKGPLRSACALVLLGSISGRSTARAAVAPRHAANSAIARAVRRGVAAAMSRCNPTGADINATPRTNAGERPFSPGLPGAASRSDAPEAMFPES